MISIWSCKLSKILTGVIRQICKKNNLVIKIKIKLRSNAEPLLIYGEYENLGLKDNWVVFIFFYTNPYIDLDF